MSHVDVCKMTKRKNSNVDKKEVEIAPPVPKVRRKVQLEERLSS